MHLFKSLALFGAAVPLAAGKGADMVRLMESRLSKPQLNNVEHVVRKSAQTNTSASSRFLNSKSKQFVVDGTKIPDVPFDIGESYAGLLPISNDPDEERKLYFWFFPSEDPKATDEIAVWLNGGPGCSSLGGLLTANGPFLWQDGTLTPIKNPYSFSRLTNYVWIDQPVGAGFSVGSPNITDQLQGAEQFKGFWKNFIDTFELKGSKMYLTGESYAGYYVPYITNSFLEANDTDYFNAKGIAINDPLFGDGDFQFNFPLLPYAEYWSKVLGFDEATLDSLRKENDACGATNYTSTYFQFPPPKKPWPEPPRDCNLFEKFRSAATKVNPCFNIYHITDTCPYVYAHLGVVNPADYSPPDGVVYFDRDDVKKAINAPLNKTWKQCGQKVFVGEGDQSLGPGIDGTLETIIDKMKNVIIGSGALDILLPTNGTLFALQNITWGGKQGFQNFPSTAFYVPEHKEETGGRKGGSGNLGYWSEERGLTFYDIQLAGHVVTGNAASVGYRVIQRLLGRIEDFSSKDPLF